jgi:hypothetical protein
MQNKTSPNKIPTMNRISGTSVCSLQKMTSNLTVEELILNPSSDRMK